MTKPTWQANESRQQYHQRLRAWEAEPSADESEPGFEYERDEDEFDAEDRSR
jgi:hypothetical protein